MNGEERFHPFEPDRLQKARTKKQVVGGASLSPQKTAVLALTHLLNRAMPLSRGAAWLRWLLQLIRALITCIVPSCVAMWDGTPMGSACNGFIWALCFIQPEASSVAAIVLFVAYLILLVVIFALLGAALVRIRKNRQAGKVTGALFVVTRIILPILSGSMIWLFTDFCKRIISQPSVPTFFLSLFALIGLLATLSVTFMGSIVTAANPIPDISDPMAAWAAECWFAGTFQILIQFNFVILCVVRSMSKQTAGIVVIVYDLVAVVPIMAIVIKRQFCINYWGYEFCMIATTEMAIMFAFVGVWMVGNFSWPYWVLFCVWFGALIVVFVVYRMIVNKRLKTIFEELDSQTLAVAEAGERDEVTTLLQESQEAHSVDHFRGLSHKSARSALDTVRAACVYNSPLFMDLSLLKWAIAGYPEVKFELLQLAFLIPNNDELFKATMEEVQGSVHMTFKHYMIIYQMMMTIQESSNELTPAILRDVSKQKLATMKCQQIVTKFWTSCYKGDISQMSRMALNVHNNIKNIDRRWRFLLSRYPRSHPIFKEYVQFLNGIGCQHGLADSITKLHPTLCEVKSPENEDDANIAQLQNSIERAVEQRPIRGIRRLNTVTCVLIGISVAFLLISAIGSIVIASSLSNSNEFVIDLFDAETGLSNIGVFACDLKEGNETARISVWESSNTVSVAFSEGALVATDAQFIMLTGKMVEIASESKLLSVNLPDGVTFLTYTGRAISGSPVDDDSYATLGLNVHNVVDAISSVSFKALSDVDTICSFYAKYGIFYDVVVWAVLVVIMIPMVYLTLRNVKKEMSYLFSFYISIPHSVLAKFAEGVAGMAVSRGPDKRSQLMRLSASFVQSRNEGNDVYESNAGNMVADGFKIIVGDSASRASVLPKYFALKTGLLIVLSVAYFGIFTTISWQLNTNFIQEYCECLWTERVAAERMSALGIATNMVLWNQYKETFDKATILENIDLAIAYHTALFSIDSAYHINKEAASVPEQKRLLFDARCDDDSDIECMSFAHVFDWFTNKLVELVEGEVVPTAEDLLKVRRVYVRDLNVMMMSSFNLFREYTEKVMDDEMIIQSVLLSASIIVFLFLFFFLIFPTMRRIDETLCSVKIPMKLIHPYDLVDIPRLIQYLRGECDWSDDKGSSDKVTEKAVGDLILNVMGSPLGVFGSDLSLLVANSEFYSLLNTSREACVGLPMAEIFSTCMAFERDETHPFNSVLQTVSQLQRGTSPVNQIQINCDLELQGKSKSPVLLKLVGIAENQNPNDEESLCADHFAIFITDLKPKLILEDKLKFESDMAARLMEAAVPRVLATALQQEKDQLTRTFTNVPLLMLSIKFDDFEDETDDVVLKVYSNVMRAAQEAGQIFASVSRIVYRPPVWVYAGGIALVGSDRSFCVHETISFALTVLEKFSESEHDPYNLCVTLHYGDITVMEIPLEVPVIEVFGADYEKLRLASSLSGPGTVLATREMADFAHGIAGITVTSAGKQSNSDGTASVQLFQLARGEEIPLE